MTEEERALDEAQKIYADISSWLNFCELKHAGMFAAYMALFIAVLQLEIDGWIGAQVVVLLALIPCLICNVISFIPVLNQRKWIKKASWRKIHPNLKVNRVFYNSIFQQSHTISNGKLNDVRSDYKNFFMSEFSGARLVSGSLLDNYLDQIVEVSSVAAIKYYLFGLACKMSSLIVVTVVVLIIVIA